MRPDGDIMNKQQHEALIASSLADQEFQRRNCSERAQAPQDDRERLVTVSYVNQCVEHAVDCIFEFIGEDLRALRKELDEVRSELALLRAIGRGTVVDLDKGVKRHVA